MFRYIPSRTVASALLIAGSLVVSACSGGSDTAPARVESGSLNLALATTANSHTYRLTNVSLYVYGNTTSTFVTTSNDPGETSLSVSLPTGSYTANLYGWTLERDVGEGMFAAVPATLDSSPYVGFAISNGTTTTVSYRFQTDGIVITVGAGELRVQAAVDEVAPVCTPFGEDCASGTWCAPTGLTSAPLACIPAGAIAVGDPCLAPSDCVAGSSCIDLAEGPVCAELCPSSLFGEACALAGVCEQAAPDYGVCR